MFGTATNASFRDRPGGLRLPEKAAIFRGKARFDFLSQRATGDIPVA